MHGTNYNILESGAESTMPKAAAMGLASQSTAEAELIRTQSDKPAETQAANPACETRSEIVGRLLDIAVALAAIILLLPVLLLICIAVILVDPGPAIFAHRRIGKDGRYFECYKFRSMYVGSEQRLAELLAKDPALRKQWSEGHKLYHDPRVTRLGHFLRIASLDELPQLFNVLIGDMSLVGPRPIVEAELPRYGRYANKYLSVKPGLTGLWQITGRSQTTYRRRIATDVLYVRSKSLMLDCRILLATVPAVLMGRGSC